MRPECSTSGTASRIAHGRAGPQQHHRDRDQEQHAHQRADEGACRDLVQGVGGDLEEWARREGDDRQQRRGGRDHQAELAQAGVAVAEPSPEPVADRERDQHDPDRVRPDDGGGAEEGRHQAGRGDLRAEARRPDHEHQDVQESIPGHQAAAPPASRPGPPSRLGLDPLAQAAALAGAHGALGSLARQRHPPLLGQLDQLLALGVLLGPEQEEPGENPQRDQASLHGHDHPGGPLVGQGRDLELGLARRVVGIEDGVGPHEDVAQRGAGEADAHHVGDLGPDPEPGGDGQRPHQRHPHQDPEADEARVLERVDRLVRQRLLVERRDVPDVEAGGPQRQRDQRDGSAPAAGRSP